LIHVYMDDVRPCPKGFVLCRTVDETIALLKECEVGILSLDYEMGWDQPPGYAVVEFMVTHGIYPREIYLHTSSSMGRAKMFQQLYKNKPLHVAVHSYPMPDEVLRRVAESQSN